MKKLLITGLFAVLGFSANAQLQKGYYMIGGELAAANIGLNAGSGYNISVSPQAAFFVKDNWAVGPYLRVGVSGAKDAPTTFNYGIGALSRYYLSSKEGLDNLLKHGRFFLEGNAGIGGTSISDGGDSANGLDLGFGPGYTYFITENIGLDAALKLNGNVGFGNKGATSDVGFRLGLNIFFPATKAVRNLKSEE